VPAACEEGLLMLGKRNITPLSGYIHSKADRPLHNNSTIFDKRIKNRLIDLCKMINPDLGVGFMGGATMIVFYKNAPDNIPIIFRGSDQQKPFVGVFPRTTDLPLPET
jgi:hypothetical protein